MEAPERRTRASRSQGEMGSYEKSVGGGGGTAALKDLIYDWACSKVSAQGHFIVYLEDPFVVYLRSPDFRGGS